jgi:hypothetical protein
VCAVCGGGGGGGGGGWGGGAGGGAALAGAHVHVKAICANVLLVGQQAGPHALCTSLTHTQKNGTTNESNLKASPSLPQQSRREVLLHVQHLTLSRFWCYHWVGVVAPGYLRRPAGAWKAVTPQA